MRSYLDVQALILQLLFTQTGLQITQLDFTVDLHISKRKCVRHESGQNTMRSSLQASQINFTVDL
jgi:hypothetical protein